LAAIFPDEDIMEEERKIIIGHFGAKAAGRRLLH
jgi:hypothetical protein